MYEEGKRDERSEPEGRGKRVREVREREGRRRGRERGKERVVEGNLDFDDRCRYAHENGCPWDERTVKKVATICKERLLGVCCGEWMSIR